jgi:hypothetical protein
MELRSTSDFGEAHFPIVNRRPHLIHIGVSVINRCDAGDRAGDVVEQFLGDMDRRAERREVRRERSAQIMQCPGRDSVRVSPGSDAFLHLSNERQLVRKHSSVPL